MRKLAVLSIGFGLLTPALAEDHGPSTRPGVIAISRMPTAAAERDQLFQTEALAKLGIALAEIKFDHARLDDALKSLADVSEENIVVHWNALATVGVPKDAPVTAHVQFTDVADALRTILATAHGQRGLTFNVQRGVVNVVPLEDPNAWIETRVYDIRRLVNTDSKKHASDAADPPELQPIYQRLSDGIGKSVVAYPTTRPAMGRDHPRVRYLRGQLIVTAMHSDKLKIHDALATAQQAVPSTQPGIP